MGYIANKWSVATLLGIFLGGLLVILGLSWASVSWFSPRLRKLDKLIILWFILSKAIFQARMTMTDWLTLVAGGIIHFFFEGYFALNHMRMGAAQDLFGQLWKEYALSDSRYLTSDPFVLCMESITAVYLQAMEAVRCVLICGAALLGSSFLLHSIHDHRQSPSTIPASGTCVAWPDIWRYPLLCY